MAEAGKRDCCSVPHGPCSVFTAFTVFIAWILSIGTAFNCSMFETDFTFNPRATLQNHVGFGWVGLGDPNSYYWCSGNSCYIVDSWCERWPDGSNEKFFDSYWDAGFALGVVAFILGTLAMIFACMTMCRAFEPGTFSCAACFFFLITICSGLSLLMLNSKICDNIEKDPRFSDLDCKMGWGGSIACAATALWFVSAVLVKCTPPYSEDDFEEEVAEQQIETTVTEEVTKNEDGTETVVTKKVTKMPDGTEQVQTTTATR
mmetsp:Transcript_6402/g.8656  ORF Transcript_6402/g.8656 Transcript_6402/m.8656 type:complete len:260 (-) Transcript_6402:317-1096(-)|eukprot:CAMPEP_0185730712 /NCGR_PEP_ID=MMETSP1171-20130828/10761_1 /TAXON_ID=374046 /ORGANISM="Helicotheca tamensis, Strain CCMP826" /LENGTH=259 /DNA_ID=CAMNT_0028399825 /DNA_START=78 /DNA_END=857 /DNA_ORIENTATION=+